MISILYWTVIFVNMTKTALSWRKINNIENVRKEYILNFLYLWCEVIKFLLAGHLEARQIAWNFIRVRITHACPLTHSRTVAHFSFLRTSISFILTYAFVSRTDEFYSPIVSSSMSCKIHSQHFPQSQ